MNGRWKVEVTVDYQYRHQLLRHSQTNIMILTGAISWIQNTSKLINCCCTDNDVDKLPVHILDLEELEFECSCFAWCDVRCKKKEEHSITTIITVVTPVSLSLSPTLNTYKLSLTTNTSRQ